MISRVLSSQNETTYRAQYEQGRILPSVSIVRMLCLQKMACFMKYKRSVSRKKFESNLLLFVG